MEPFCGSAQANAKRAHWNLEETRASSNGPSISVKKRREKAKNASNVYRQWFPTIFSILACCEHNLCRLCHVSIEVVVGSRAASAVNAPIVFQTFAVGRKQHILAATTFMQATLVMKFEESVLEATISDLDMYHLQKERIY